MGYKLGLILSLVFIVQIFIFCTDIIAVQYMYSSLDALSLEVGKLITYKGRLTDDIRVYAQGKMDCEVMCVSACNPSAGDILTYTLTCQYTPIVMSKTPWNIKITRGALIGFN